MNKEIFDIDQIYIDIEVKNKKEAFKFIAQAFVDSKTSSDLKVCYKGLLDREKEGSTGFNEGIAIPHAKIKEITHPKVFVIKFKQGVEWKSIDGSKVNLAIALAIPADKVESDHLKILSSIARKLIDDDFRNKLNSSKTKEEFFTIVNKVEII
ncbi:PTS sugar transporter subunit IIA [Spiroplasma alleghenense]|uniref:PTS system, fructose-specific IIA component n=1 Tax=Spiroplasma alleghenense TaxID=216931 RepID=A0A345Z312_9MOLU|nr:PTS sugar transporter subunit IIA [Spiroplasma alleghenense]AXK50991.1 PTS system, fructose-specific IIA component [Spiroplasma alleghenense]